MTEQTEPGTAVATTDPAQQALAVYEYGEDDAGGGFENTTKDDFKLPFLRVLQSNSPAVVDELVAGAKPGLIINTVTGALFSRILFIPAITQHVMVGWKPRGEGQKGGQSFVGVWEMDDPMVQAALKAQGGKFNRGADKKIIKPKTPDEDDLVETVYVHGVQFIEETEALLPAVLSFSSTGLPVSQNWLTMARAEVIPGSAGKSRPLYGHVYGLNTAKTVNAWGTFFNFSPTWARGSAEKSRLATNSSLFLSAKSVKEMVLAGKAEIDHAAQGNSSAEAGTTSQGGSSARGGKAAGGDVPF